MMPDRARIPSPLYITVSITLLIVVLLFLRQNLMSRKHASPIGPTALAPTSAAITPPVHSCVNAGNQDFEVIVASTTRHRSPLGFEVTIPAGWCLADPSPSDRESMLAYDPATCNLSPHGNYCERSFFVHRGVYTSFEENIHRIFADAEDSFSRSNELQLLATRTLVPGAVAIWSHSDYGGLPGPEWTILYENARLAFDVMTGIGTFERTIMLPTFGLAH